MFITQYTKTKETIISTFRNADIIQRKLGDRNSAIMYRQQVYTHVFGCGWQEFIHQRMNMQNERKYKHWHNQGRSRSSCPLGHCHGNGCCWWILFCHLRHSISSITIKEKVKEADFYSTFIEVPYTQGTQVRIIQCYLQITLYLPLPRKHSPDGASQTEVADI